MTTLNPFFHSQPIFSPGEQPFQSCHASTLVETADGRLLAAWFGGTEEGAPDVAIWLAERRDETWSRPVKVAEVPGVPLWNPVLFRDIADTLWLFYKVAPAIPAWTGAYLRSTDGGATWSAPTYLPAGLLGPAKNKPILLSNGEILCGVSAESWQAWACWVEIISDNGENWRRFGPITAPQSGEDCAEEGFAGVIQPTVWEYAPGRLTMLMRATRRVGCICESHSDDYGRTWSPARPTALPNANSGIDAARLADGRVALVYNPTRSGRSPLMVAISEDNGVTWPRQRALETQPGEFSYPAIIQTRDGRLNITYTCQRTTIQHVTLTSDF